MYTWKPSCSCAMIRSGNRTRITKFTNVCLSIRRRLTEISLIILRQMPNLDLFCRCEHYFQSFQRFPKAPVFCLETIDDSRSQSDGTILPLILCTKIKISREIQSSTKNEPTFCIISATTYVKTFSDIKLSTLTSMLHISAYTHI